MLPFVFFIRPLFTSMVVIEYFVIVNRTQKKAATAFYGIFPLSCHLKIPPKR